MKRLKTFLTSLLVTLLLLAASNLSAQQTFKTTSQSVIGFLQYLPKDYASNSNKYPVIIFLHGYGERGPNTTNKADLEASAWSLVTKHGPPKHVKNGVSFPFIIISPQLKNNMGSWPSSYVWEVINYCKTYLRIDEKRIHVTGLSMGGGGSWNMAQDYAGSFASVAPVCGHSNESKACNIAKDNLPIWAFHGDADNVVSLSESKNMVNAINSCSANPRALVSIYPGVRHSAWDRAYTPNHTYHNPNVYDWMLAQKNTRKGSNYIPTANAGSDIAISSGSSVSLSGSGSDSDGTIASYKWTKISGPSANISSSSSRSTSVSGMSAGTYIFRLQVTDDKGAVDADYVKVTIGSSTSSSTTNKAPVANAGSDFSITLPTNSATISGSATDSDGSISSYSWSKISGGSASLSGTSSSKLSVSGLVAGTYVFRLTVKDNSGATDTDDMTLTVRSSTSTSNVAPVASAGSDRTVKLPVSSVDIAGSGRDSDGSISSYRWVQISGPTVSLSNTSGSTLRVNNPVSGRCVFRLTVKDNAGASDYDDVVVTFSYPPKAYAGNDVSKPFTREYIIVGKGTDSDGTISSYSWTKIQGPSVTVSGSSTSSVKMTNMVSGTYVWRLTVKDNTGLTHYDDIKLVFN